MLVSRVRRKLLVALNQLILIIVNLLHKLKCGFVSIYDLDDALVSAHISSTIIPITPPAIR